MFFFLSQTSQLNSVFTPTRTNSDFLHGNEIELNPCYNLASESLLGVACVIHRREVAASSVVSYGEMYNTPLVGVPIGYFCE